MANLAASLKRVVESRLGPSVLNVERSHYVDKKNDIYEFVAGRMRLLWFQSPVEQRVIICSHLFMKKTQKTPLREVTKALKVKEDYLTAFQKGQLEVIEEKEENP